MGFKKTRIRKVCAGVLSVLITAVSVPFTASLNAGALVTDPAGDYDNFAKALQYSLHFYDANMCGPEVEDHSMFKWRANCHVYDAEVPLKTMESFTTPSGEIGTNLSEEFIKENYDILNTGKKDGTVDVSGGYHDAGDHVKFGLPEAYSGTTVSWGYLEFRDAYIECEQQKHVETIIKHFCDYFMRCTFRDDKGEVKCFCYQVGDGDIDHAYWQLPQNDEMNRPAWFATPDNPTTCNICNTAACLVINYLNFKDTEPEYAEKCLDYGKALYEFAKKNDKQKAVNDQGPDQYYTSEKWEDDYCFAACWLYLVTGDDTYINDMLPYYDFYAPSGYCYCWNDMWNGVGILMGRISETYKSGKTYTEAENPLGQCDLAIEYMKAADKNPYEAIDFWGQCAKAYHGYMSGSPGTITPQGYWWLNTWGSCRYNTAAQLMMLIYDKYTNGKDYNEREKLEDYGFTEWAKGQMEYILGNNDITYLEKGDKSHGPRCFLTGFDENSAAYPHHRAASGLTKCEDEDQQLYVLFGALCGGPDADDCHNDVTKDWIYNEVTIDYNAACPGAAAGLYLAYKDKYKQSITPNFPPEDDGGRGASDVGQEGGGKGTWVEACGIDDINAEGAGVTKVSFMVKSNEAKAPENMTVRYYINTSEISDFAKIEASILYDQVSAEAEPNKAEISKVTKWDRDDKYAYVEFNWGKYNFVNCGKKLQFKVGFYYGDKWDPTNDPSYTDLKIYKEDDAFFGTGNEVRTDNICVYADGKLIGGVEPDGSVPDVGSASTETTKASGTTTTASNVKNSDKTTQTTAKAVKTRGDVNCDKEVDVSDAVLLARLLSEDKEANITAQGKINADCDDDDELSPQDTLKILRHIAKIEEFKD
ncbi:MAG: glycoside hydrolase family 9 protein [Oscillospiraceae bacterium]|nr:glycoside hydrolase family 9 protein [Oscillospiraceae bacterium]